MSSPSALARLVLIATAATFSHAFAPVLPAGIIRTGAPSMMPLRQPLYEAQRIGHLRGVVAGPLSESKKGYYETIDGIKYDRGIMDAARAAVEGKGDGRVSKADADDILAAILDGNTISEIEYRTAFLILRDFKFTDEAQKAFIEKLATSE